MPIIMDYEFKKNISISDLNCLNEILASDSLGLEDKKFAVFIGDFLKGTTCIDSSEISILKYFTDFCLNKDINLKCIFTPLLYSISQNISEVMLDENINNSNIALLKNKIYTLISVGLDSLDLESSEFSFLVVKVFNSNVSSQNYSFIRELFRNKAMKNNFEKLNLIFTNLLLSNNLVLSDNNFGDMLDILSNEKLLELDNISYRRALDIIFSDNKGYSYMFNIVINNPGMTITKMVIAIDYFCNLIEKNSCNFSFEMIKRIMNDNDINIFNIVCCDRLLLMNDEEYKDTLNKVISSNRVFSFVKVMGSSCLNDEQRDIALELIEQGDFSVNKNYFNKDYKDAVARAAISPVLVNCSIRDYIKILEKINYWSCELQTLFESGVINDRIIFGSISEGIVKMLNCSELYLDNLDRVYMTMDILLKVNPSELLIKELINFACSSESSYYNDLEYVMILELINKSYDSKLYTEVSGLFMNSNVMYMDDKNLLFDVAKTDDKKNIEELTSKLNELGYYNRNMSNLFKGVDNETINLVMGSTISRVRSFLN